MIAALRQGLRARLLAGLRGLLRAAADAVFDPRCAAGEHGLDTLKGPACAACCAALDAELLVARCPACSAALRPEAASGTPCAPCAARPRRVAVQAPREHAGVARALVLAMKRARREDAALVLARATAQDAGVAAALRIADVLVPVPAHPVRRRERGFNPAEALARGLSTAARERGLGRRRVALALDLRAGTGRQAARTASSRRRALRGTMRITLLGRRSVRGRRVALVDDVVTTGATAMEAARVLVLAGAASVEVVACTRAPGALMDLRGAGRRSP